MRKICLLFSIILCCLSSLAQGLGASPTTIVSGGTVTFTGSSESYNSNYFYTISAPTISSTDPFAAAYVHATSGRLDSRAFGPDGPTTFKMTFENTHPVETYTVDLKFSTSIQTPTGGRTEDRIVTITVKPAPVSYKSVAKSQIFYKNNCGAGFESDPYTYLVPYGKYSGSTQLEADNKALAEINANGQNTANANLTCKQVYYNTEVTGSFTRNTCGAHTSTVPVSYTVPANQFKGFSQADADAKANSELNIKGQANANNIGVCTPLAYIDGPTSIYMTVDNTFSVVNASQGDTFEWIFPAIRFEIMGGGINEDYLAVRATRTGGTNPYTFSLKVKITKTNGQVLTLTKNVTILYCLNCPI